MLRAAAFLTNAQSIVGTLARMADTRRSRHRSAVKRQASLWALIHICTYRPRHAYACTHAHKHKRAHKRAHTQTHTQKHADTYKCRRTLNHARTCNGKIVHAHKNIHAEKHMRTHTTHTRTHTQTYKYKSTHTHTYRHIHKCINTNTHTDTNTWEHS